MGLMVTDRQEMLYYGAVKIMGIYETYFILGSYKKNICYSIIRPKL
jgi:hypothetical protein